MKKLLSLALVITLTLALFGCSNDAKKEPAQQPSVTSSALHPDAKIETFVTEEGEVGHTYQNPDGSGGGGMEIEP